MKKAKGTRWKTLKGQDSKAKGTRSKTEGTRFKS